MVGVSLSRIRLHWFYLVIRNGSRVIVSGGRSGVVRYVGVPHFAPGDWVGVELDTPTGKNNGTVAGKRLYFLLTLNCYWYLWCSYFVCPENFGIFSPLNAVRQLFLIRPPFLLIYEKWGGVFPAFSSFSFQFYNPHSLFRKWLTKCFNEVVWQHCAETETSQKRLTYQLPLKKSHRTTSKCHFWRSISHDTNVYSIKKGVF